LFFREPERFSEQCHRFPTPRAALTSLKHCDRSCGYARLFGEMFLRKSRRVSVLPQQLPEGDHSRSATATA
jgi:hypothetical protein